MIIPLAIRLIAVVMALIHIAACRPDVVSIPSTGLLGKICPASVSKRGGILWFATQSQASCPLPSSR